MREENIILGAGTEYPLKGILTLPSSGEVPFPAVVFVHGSGSSNMDEKVGKLTPFKDLAQGLALHGITSVRYDKRSFAHGRKMVKKGNITVREETIEDALLATELLRKDPRIDAKRVFIVGHSMGAMLSPRIDAEGGDYRGLILMAGSLRTLEEIMLDQNRTALEQMNPLLRRIAGKQIKKMEATFANLYDLTDEEAKKKAFAGGTTLYYFKEMGSHPASAYLEKSCKPMLIMQGEKDFQATAETDFKGYRELLAGRENVTFRLYENLNHAFVPYQGGSILKARQEYGVEQHIGETVIADIARWILSL